MKNLLLVAGGVLLFVGGYKLYQATRKKKSCGCGDTGGTMIAVVQPGQAMPAPDPRAAFKEAATERYDTNPVSTFAPAKTQIFAPANIAYAIENYNMANELVSQ